MKECWVVSGGKKQKAAIASFDGYFYLLYIKSIITAGSGKIRVPKGRVYESEEAADEARGRYRKHVVVMSPEGKREPIKRAEQRKLRSKEPWRMWTWASPGFE